MARFFFLSFVFISFFTVGQDITQSVSGKVKDITSGAALVSASVSVYEKDNLIAGASTDTQGQFVITVPPGRYRMEISFTGYTSVERELLVIAGKMNVIEIELQESATILSDVVVTPETIAEPGVTSLSIEKTMRAPANFFDPVRMLTSYPGVVTANDQANSIAVKGYSPNGVLWRLQGLDIVNPNHTANAGTLSD